VWKEGEKIERLVLRTSYWRTRELKAEYTRERKLQGNEVKDSEDESTGGGRGTAGNHQSAQTNGVGKGNKKSRAI